MIHRAGRVAEALRASIAIPGLLPPVCTPEGVLVDGGMMNNLPADVMARLKRGRVLAVDVGSDLAFQAMPTRSWRGRTLRRWLGAPDAMPAIAPLLLRAATVSSDAQSMMAVSQASVVLKPALAGIDLRAWSSFEEIAVLGADCARDALASGGLAAWPIRAIDRVAGRPPQPGAVMAQAGIRHPAAPAAMPCPRPGDGGAFVRRTRLDQVFAREGFIRSSNVLQPRAALHLTAPRRSFGSRPSPFVSPRLRGCAYPEPMHAVVRRIAMSVRLHRYPQAPETRVSAGPRTGRGRIDTLPEATHLRRLQMPIRAVLVLMLASVATPAMALEPQDTLRDWKTASGADRDRVLKQLEDSLGGAAPRKDVLPA